MSDISTFERVCASLPSASTIVGDERAQERLALYESLPLETQDAIWQSLERECREDIRRDPQVGKRWERQRSRSQPRSLSNWSTSTNSQRHVFHSGDDVLHTVPPEQYVEALTGEQVPRSGMLLCPLPGHDERTPSFHVWLEGWFCHGCHRGGDVYNLAGELWGLDPRRDFPELRQRLARFLLGEAVAA